MPTRRLDGEPKPGERWLCASCGSHVVLKRDLHRRHRAQCSTCLSFRPDIRIAPSDSPGDTLAAAGAMALDRGGAAASGIPATVAGSG